MNDNYDINHIEQERDISEELTPELLNDLYSQPNEENPINQVEDNNKIPTKKRR